MTYQPKDVVAPRLVGPALRAVTLLAERPVAGRLLRAHMQKQLGIDRLGDVAVGEHGPARPPFRSRLQPDAAAGSPTQLADAAARAEAAEGEGFRFASLADYADAYAEGRSSPVEVARRLLDALAESERGDAPLRLFIDQSPDDLMAQAEASTELLDRGAPRSVLEGVPIAVKDEVDMVPYPTTVGTRFLGQRAAGHDASTVARLRSAGALLVGKANMHELGLGVTGVNPHHGAVRNPWDPSRVTGGSSSGAAAAVASGICVGALGADGGGSIRIPAALCGMVGLKPTYGRVSEHGAAPLCWSVAHLGPIAAHARDAAALYAVLGGPDPADPGSTGQPPLQLDAFPRRGLAGVRLGIYTRWFEHADEEVVRACRAALRRLEEAGATLVEIAIPELSHARAAHLVIIASEMLAARKNDPAGARAKLGLDVRLNLALAADMTGAQYVQAKRVRARVMASLESILDDVDGIATPATGCTAPPIREDVLTGGESNLPVLDRIMRFSPLANLTGHPAITFPVGADSDGLPVGLQIIGRAWREDLLLALAHAGERTLVRSRPRRHWRLLE